MTHARGIGWSVGVVAFAFGPVSAACQELVDTQAGPSYVRTLAGTLGGGLIGAAAIALPAALLLEATTDDQGFVPAGVIGIVLGAPVGYWVGQALGASWGSATRTHQVPVSKYLLPAALWTGAGLAIFGLIGDGFDPEYGDDSTSWYVGAVVGGVVQLVGMSLTAHRIAVRDGAPSPSPSQSPFSMRFRLEPGRRFVAETCVHLVW